MDADRKSRKRALILAAVVSLLVAANLWRFWPSSVTERTGIKTGTSPGGVFRAEDFVVRALPTVEHAALRRDLFRIGAVTTAAPKSAPKGSTPQPPPKTPEQIAVESAQTELAQIRCVGAAYHKQRAEAFLIVNGQNTIVRVGEKAGGRFVVEEITRDSVLLRDPATQTVGRIAISGQQ